MIWNQLGLWAQCFSFEAVDHEFESDLSRRDLPATRTGIGGVGCSAVGKCIYAVCWALP